MKRLKESASVLSNAAGKRSSSIGPKATDQTTTPETTDSVVAPLVPACVE